MNNPLHNASQHGHVDAMRLLIEHGASVNAKNEWDNTPLHKASFKGHTDAMKLLIEHGADVYAKDKWDKTPLSMHHGMNILKQ